MKRNMTVINFAYPVNILGDFLELCTHFYNLQCLIDNVYQQPYFIMAAKQKRGFESNYKSLKK